MGIAVLGPLTVDGDAGRLGPRDRVVLAALTVRPGEWVSAERLADALWHGEPPGTWTKVVQGCVVRLRKVLGADVIETSRLGYRLVLSADEIDTQRFERMVGRGRELLTLAEPERAAYVLNEAISLWRGPALTELDGWAPGGVEAVRLGELRRDAEELSVDAALRAGRCREVLTEAQALVAQAPLRERRWALLALAQYQAGRQAEALRTLRQVRTVLATELGLDPGPDLLALEQAILRQDATLVAETALPEPSATCPYQGLLPYGVADGDAFFGRDKDIGVCLRRLTATGVLVVVGPSGSGKSSLVRAGVAAALERDGRRVVVVTPGLRPMDALTAVPPSGAATLIVDQCEEAITLCNDPDERARFFRSLVAQTGRGGLVVTIRADRMGDLAAYPEFARLVERGLHLLSAMSPEDLRACIEGPAHQAGLLLEPGLVDLLVREVQGEPGALPLLSHALRETWEQREGRTLTVAGYRLTGGINGAVARSAEEVYDRVDPEQRPVLRDLMMRLVTPSSDGDPVRSRLPRRLVATDAPHEQIIELMVGARLVTTDDGVLELAHEALVRSWPRFREWLDDDTEGQRIRRHLTAAADAWETMGRPVTELYRGVRLAQALDWRNQARPDLTEVELAFLDASQAQVDEELKTAKGQAAAEASSRRRTRRLAVGLAAGLALALLTAVLAVGYQRSATDREAEAQLASIESDGNRLAALSKSVGSLDLSLLLAAEAMRTADTSATRDGLLASLAEHWRALQVVRVGRTPFDTELADHGQTLFVSTQTEVLAWDVNGGVEPRTVVRWDQPDDIAASPTDDLVAVWTRTEQQPMVGVFDSAGREKLRLEGFDAIGGWPLTFGFSADGERLRMGVMRELDDGRRRNQIQEYDVASGQRTRSIPVHEVGAHADWAWATFADDGTRAIVWDIGGSPRATQVDLRTGATIPLRPPKRDAEPAAYSPLPEGARLTWADGAVTLFDGRGRPTQLLQPTRTR